jgi:hypothetical protein
LSSFFRAILFLEELRWVEVEEGDGSGGKLTISAAVVNGARYFSRSANIENQREKISEAALELLRTVLFGNPG